MNNVVKVSNQLTRSLYKPKDGEVVFQEDTKEFFIYKNNSYIPVPKDTGIQMGLYELNAQIMEQLPNMSKESLANKKALFKEFINKTDNNYYMLYGKEISYFTLFNTLGSNIGYIGYEIFHDFYECLLDCLYNIGEIKSIDLTKSQDAFEIWAKTPEGKITCLYFFPYDTGIVYIQEAK